MSRTVETVYDFLYGAIAGGRLKPGSHLAEESIAEQLGVSRTPVREAIRRLESEGLVIVGRNSGADVVSLSEEEVAETFRLRAMLEGYAAERAATRITAAQLAHLVEINAGMAAQFGGDAAPDQLAVGRLNTAFHLTIAVAADSRRLVGLIRALVNLPLALMHEGERQEGWAAKLARTSGTEEQAEIIEALSDRDPVLARTLMELHILRGRPVGNRPHGAGVLKEPTPSLTLPRPAGEGTPRQRSVPSPAKAGEG